MAGVEAKPLKKANKPYKIRREGSFVNGFRWSWGFVDEQDNIRNNLQKIINHQESQNKNTQEKDENDKKTNRVQRDL